MWWSVKLLLKYLIRATNISQIDQCGGVLWNYWNTLLRQQISQYAAISRSALGWAFAFFFNIESFFSKNEKSIKSKDSRNDVKIKILKSGRYWIEVRIFLYIYINLFYLINWDTKENWIHGRVVKVLGLGSKGSQFVVRSPVRPSVVKIANHC